MYKRILVAVDDSETSRCALAEAINIAGVANARLHVVHVADEVLLGMHHRAVTTTLDFDHAMTAIRDAESRVMFIGYNPLWYKLFVWTLSALLCAVAGALYVPQVGIINPSEMSVANSIEIAIWVAVGGRGTLIGPVIGAFIVNLAKSWFTVSFPEYWLFFLGTLFIVATLYLPQGIVGLCRKLRAGMKRDRHPLAPAAKGVQA